MDEDERLATIQGLNRQIADLKALSDADGRMSVRDGYLLLDEWQSSITYGGIPVLELGDAVDIPKDVLKREIDSFGVHNQTHAVPWGLIGVAATTLFLYYWLGRSHFLTGLGFGICAVIVIQLGARAGRHEGYWDGVQRGYAVAIMRTRGIENEAAEREFWDCHHQAKGDRRMADRLRGQGS